MPLASRVAAEVLRVLPRKHISRAMGRLADLEGPSPLVQSSIRAFVRAYDVDMSEAVIPAEGFASFDAFFTRELKDGARTPDPRADVVVSPADGRVEDLGRIETDAKFRVKGFDYTVAELLGSAEEAEHYRGGAFFIVYLSPRDYHRVHAPVDGRVRRARHVDGTLYPVNSLGLRYVKRLFARNERVVTIQASDFGEVATVMVGAIGVGRISMSYDERIVTNQGAVGAPIDYGDVGPQLRRGGELGRFHLGSTAIVLLGPAHDYRFMVQAGKRVQLGEAIVTRRSALS